MDEGQLGYPECGGSTILYPCLGTSALALSVNAPLVNLSQLSHLVPGHGARVRYSVGTNVNTLFFQVPTLEFGHADDAGARVQGLDLVLGHQSGHWVPVFAQFL